jgi:hypothetical protein
MVTPAEPISQDDKLYANTLPDAEYYPALYDISHRLYGRVAATTCRREEWGIISATPARPYIVRTLKPSMSLLEARHIAQPARKAA